MTKARDIMTTDTQCVGENQTLADAARMLRDLDVGALPICGEDNRLKGVLTDRDLVTRCLAEGGDPNTAKAGEFSQGEAVTIGADDSLEEAVKTMATHKVRRLPVIDGHQLIGIVAGADVARALPDRPVGDLIDAISE